MLKLLIVLRKSKIFYKIILLLILILIYSILILFFENKNFIKNNLSIQNNKKFVELKNKNLSNKQTYQIIQSKNTWPKILEAVIDPPDVHVGDRQYLSIIVQSPNNIKSVVAYIETDNGTTTLPLNFVGEIKDDNLLYVKYLINNENKLVILDSQYNQYGLFNNFINNFILKAKSENEENYPKLKYENSWIVRDTHNKYYHTTFVVEDEKGNINSITLAWSDACGIPNSGPWTISGNCTINSTDGVENGNVTIQTYTLTLNSTFVWNPGYSITINSGAIAINTNAQLRKTYLWLTDADADNYPANFIQYAQDSPCSGCRRRSQVTYFDKIDCNDNNPSSRSSSGSYYCCLEFCPNYNTCLYTGYYFDVCAGNNYYKCFTATGPCKLNGYQNFQTTPNASETECINVDVGGCNYEYTNSCPSSQC